MNLLDDKAISPADLQAINNLRPTVDQLTPAGRRKLLSLLARDCLTTEPGNVTLVNDNGDVFAHLSSAEHPPYDFSDEFTAVQLAIVEEALLDPKKSMTVEEMLAQIDAEDDRTDPPR